MIYDLNRLINRSTQTAANWWSHHDELYNTGMTWKTQFSDWGALKFVDCRKRSIDWNRTEAIDRPPAELACSSRLKTASTKAEPRYIPLSLTRDMYRFSATCSKGVQRREKGREGQNGKRGQTPCGFCGEGIEYFDRHTITRDLTCINFLLFKKILKKIENLE